MGEILKTSIVESEVVRTIYSEFKTSKNIIMYYVYV